MKKFITLSTLKWGTVALISASLLAGAPVARGALTADIKGQLEGTGIATGLSAPDLPTTVGRIINIVLSLVGVIFLVLTVYAGFLWMTAAGEKENVEKAKTILRTSIIGLIITLAAFAISNFVVTEITKTTGLVQ